MNSRPMKIFARDVQWEFSREVCSSLYRRATLSPGAGRWDGPNVCLVGAVCGATINFLNRNPNSS